MSPKTNFKQKLNASEAQLGLFVTLESPTITDIAARMKLDWVVIDTEHGHLDYKEVSDHLRALRGSETIGLVRVQEIEQGVIKRILDLGADGIIIPLRTARGGTGSQFRQVPSREFRHWR
jgi:2-keto-3-deoxy-L-rhamnonate aldolase RhmA